MNRKKHEHQKHVLCPKCKTPVQIRKRILGFDIKWPEIKLHAAAEKAEIKRRAKERPSREIEPMFMPAHAQTAGLLALSMMMAKKNKEKGIS